MLNKILCTVGCFAMTSLGTVIVNPVQAQQPTSIHTAPASNLIANACECARYRACQIRQRALTAVPIIATPVAVTPPPVAEQVITPAPEPIAPPVEYRAPRARG